jgi:outer membrane protein assembly factor BamB
LRWSGSCYSSPVTGDGKVYLVDDRGRLTVVSAVREWEVVAQGDFEESTYATPAIVEGRIYLRTAGHLYCFGIEDKK